MKWNQDMNIHIQTTNQILQTQSDSTRKEGIEGKVTLCWWECFCSLCDARLFQFLSWQDFPSLFFLFGLDFISCWILSFNCSPKLSQVCPFVTRLQLKVSLQRFLSWKEKRREKMDSKYREKSSPQEINESRKESSQEWVIGYWLDSVWILLLC